MSYRMNKQDVVDFAAAQGIEVKEKGDEITFRECPMCKNGGHPNREDEWKFSVNAESGAFCCPRASCGYHGHFVQLCRDFGYRLPDVIEPKVYRTFTKQIKADSDDSAIEYFKKRGISKEVINEYHIVSDASHGHPNMIMIPQYDENDVLTAIKWRDAAYTKDSTGPKEWWEKDCKPILFGMQKIDESIPTMVVTEGQIDALSLVEAGIKNAYAVPGGATNFNWVEHCGDWIREHFNTIIVFGDNEKGKITLYDEIASRFSDLTVKCVRKIDYLGEKDANDILRKFGVKELQNAYDNAEVPRPPYLISLSDIEYVDESSIRKSITGIKAIDKALGGGMCAGELIVITGYAGTGKSTLASQLVATVTSLRNENGITNGLAVVYSGETTPERFRRSFDRQLLYILYKGNKQGIAECLNVTQNKYGDKIYEVVPDVVSSFSSYYKNRVLYHDPTLADANSGDFLAQIETDIKVSKPNIVLVDNLMTAVEGIDEADLNRAQSFMAGALKRMAVKYGTTVILVAHPRKTPSGMKKAELKYNSDISGSADITNKADVVLMLDRDTDSEQEPDKRILRCTKNRRCGTLAETELDFNPDTLVYIDRAGTSFEEPIMGVETSDE